MLNKMKYFFFNLLNGQQSKRWHWHLYQPKNHVFFYFFYKFNQQGVSSLKWQRDFCQPKKRNIYVKSLRGLFFSNLSKNVNISIIVYKIMAEGLKF